MNIYYTYIYLDPRKPSSVDTSIMGFLFEPFYVGKGKSDRLLKHMNLKNTTNSLKIDKIKRILNAGVRPIILKISENLSEQEALSLERLLISEIGTKWCIKDIKRGPLTNMTSGGDGWSLSEETKKVLSIANSGVNNPMFGKHRTEEEKQKLRDFRKTFKHTEATKKHFSEIRQDGNNSNAKKWKIKLPSDQIIEVKDLKGWCGKNNINYNTLFNTLSRRTPIARGSSTGYQLLNV